MNPPSPTGEDKGAGRDLLAHARDLLSPEVDVVELAAAGPREVDEMTALTRAAAPLVAGAVALSGCSPSHAEIRATAAGSKSAVLKVSRDVLTELTSLGRLPLPAQGMWRSCRDKAGWLQYFVDGRIDPLPGTTGQAPLAERVTDALAPRGYRLQVVDDGAGVLTLETVTGEVNIQVTGYPSDPFVLFDISGACVEVDDLDGELRYELPEILT